MKPKPATTCTINRTFIKPLQPGLYACLLFLFACGHLPCFSQARYNTEVPKDIIIIKSAKAYDSALAEAKRAAERLHRTLDLRGLKPIEKTGLTASKKECAGSGGSDDMGYPCYLARGDGNAANDNYISVEYSNAYQGFAKGYYIVVAAITDVKPEGVKPLLAGIKKMYPDAYAKRTHVWFGCMH